MSEQQKLDLPYGKKKLQITVPAHNLVDYVTMKDLSAVSDPVQAIEETLENPVGSKPLEQIVQRGCKVAIAIDDLTRPTPSKLLLESILPRLHRGGVNPGDIDIIVATGMHRPLTNVELIGLLGDEIYSKYRVSNHQPNNREANEPVGLSKSGNPVLINKTFMAADIRILTGYIRPHVVFGFSGGRKSVVPGLADVETVKYNHRREWVVHDPNCDNLNLEGNPAHQEALEIAKRVGISFIVNVVLNRDKKIIRVVAGDLEQAWLSGLDTVRQMTTTTVKEVVDIVICTPGGYPDDYDMYQTLGSIIISRKKPVFKKGATFIFAAECPGGVGNDKMLATFKTATNPLELARKIKAGEPVINGHVSYAFSHFISEHHLEVFGKTECVSPEDLKSMYIIPVENLQETIDSSIRKHGPQAKVLVVPNAKNTVVTLY